MNMNAVNTVAADLQTGTPAVPAATEPQTLADVIGVSETPAEQQPKAQPASTEVPQQEPGWYQGRMQKERARWDAEHQAAMAEMTSKQNALLERIIARDAQDLVSSGEFKSLERATEYLRMKEGLPVNQEQPQPRDAQGRFVAQPPAGPDQTMQQRAQALVNQAESLTRATGVDVMNIYNTNPEVKQKVLSGEWDFADVLKNGGFLQQQAAKPHMPSAVRSANGVAIGQTNIGGMTQGQFDTMNAFLAKGGKIDMR